MALYSREVPLTARHLATMASPLADPEAQMQALQERQSEGDEASAPVLPERVLAVIRGFLPPEEAYLLEAYYMRGQFQSDIARRLGRVTQQCVEYRLRRAVKRVQWALTLESWDRTAEQIQVELEPLTPAEIAFAIVLWAHRWNQSRTARHLAMTQPTVRVRVVRLRATLLRQTRESVGIYARDLTRVFDAHAWCMGGIQVQGKRSAQFPKFRRYG